MNEREKEKIRLNKIKNYPVLDSQQLLSLIRVSQILIKDLEERVHKLENEER